MLRPAYVDSSAARAGAVQFVGGRGIVRDMSGRMVASIVVIVAAIAGTAIAAPVAKPKEVKPQVRAAALRISSGKLPRLTTYLKPIVRPIDPIWANTAPPGTPEPPPTPASPADIFAPPLTEAEYATDVLEFTPGALGSAQVGVVAVGIVQTFPRAVWYTLSVWMQAAAGSFHFYPRPDWIEGRSLLVECVGWFREPSAVTYGRLSDIAMEEMGSMTIDLAGEDQLAFVVPPVPLAGWNRAYISIRDADQVGNDFTIRRCTLTRL